MYIAHKLVFLMKKAFLYTPCKGIRKAGRIFSAVVKITDSIKPYKGLRFLFSGPAYFHCLAG